MRQQLPEVVLGSYVTTPAGQTGRVYQLHHTCPQDDAWMAAQVTFVAGAYRAHPWGSVLCHGGGAVVFPLDLLVPVEPFALDHPHAEFYFGAPQPGALGDPCPACGAEPLETCRVGCLGQAQHDDEVDPRACCSHCGPGPSCGPGAPLHDDPCVRCAKPAETFEQAMARLDVVEAALEAREARLDRLEDGLGRLAVTLNNALPLSALGRG